MVLQQRLTHYQQLARRMVDKAIDEEADIKATAASNESTTGAAQNTAAEKAAAKAKLREATKRLSLMRYAITCMCLLCFVVCSFPMIHTCTHVSELCSLILFRAVVIVETPY